MTENDTKKLLALIQATYTDFKPVDRDATIAMWSTMLQNYPYRLCEMALQAYIASNTTGFYPKIGQLIEKIRLISCPQELNEEEAWALVSNALRNGYYGAEQEFEKLPEIVQKAVGSPSNLRNWSQTDSESVETVLHSNFIKTYRIEVKRAQEVSVMPDHIKKLIESMESKRIQIAPMQQTEKIEQKREHQGEISQENEERLKKLREGMGT